MRYPLSLEVVLSAGRLRGLANVHMSCRYERVLRKKRANTNWNQFETQSVRQIKDVAKLRRDQIQSVIYEISEHLRNFGEFEYGGTLSGRFKILLPC